MGKTWQEIVDDRQEIVNSIEEKLFFKREQILSLMISKELSRYDSKREFLNAEIRKEERLLDFSKENLAEAQKNLAEAQKNLVEEKRRFVEYWATHQSEKETLELEKKSLAEQIDSLVSEISEIPQRTDGYTDMMGFYEKIKKLTSEKKALGFFKLAAKRVIQKQIDSIHIEIAPIQSRINSAKDEVQKRISSLQDRIKAIDIELTKPR